MRFIQWMFTENVSGAVIAHQPWFIRKFIGSPSLCVISGHEYVATHDFFGPNSQEFERPETRVYVSSDQGSTWQLAARVQNVFWARVFLHNGALYLLGTDAHYGNLVIRTSKDAGKTWSHPTNHHTGLIKQGQFHCAPTPVVTYNNHLWAAVEFADGLDKEWGKRFGASMFSIKTDANLLEASNWSYIAPYYYNSEFLNGNFGGWLEGNAVVGADAALYNVLRVENDATYQESAALLKVRAGSSEFEFDPDHDFVSFPGGSKKFSIRHDAASGLYISLANTIASDVDTLQLEPDAIRNQVSLVVSKDLHNWRSVSVILDGNSLTKTAFQYISWDFAGDDIIFVSRTAYYDMWGGAKSYHDSNYLTFHRIHNFRQYLLQ